MFLYDTKTGLFTKQYDGYHAATVGIKSGGIVVTISEVVVSLPAGGAYSIMTEKEVAAKYALTEGKVYPSATVVGFADATPGGSGATTPSAPRKVAQRKTQ